jgi:hypothetical protein
MNGLPMGFMAEGAGKRLLRQCLLELQHSVAVAFALDSAVGKAVCWLGAGGQKQLAGVPAGAVLAPSPKLQAAGCCSAWSGLSSEANVATERP